MQPTATSLAPPPTVLVLSSVRSLEMEPALAAVARCFPDADLRFANDPAAAVRLVGAERWFPDLAVVCQHWPDEYAAADVARLLALLPLARWICVCGCWCESDGRNGTPWPDAVRVPARSAEARIRLERSVLAGRTAALPLTASRDEVFAFDNQPALTLPSPRGRGIHSLPSPSGRGLREGAAGELPAAAIDKLTTVMPLIADVELRRVVCDLAVSAGLVAATSPPSCRGGLAIVWDADPISSDRRAELCRLRAVHPAAVIVALATMAHPADIEMLTAAGAAAVLPKLQLAALLPEMLDVSPLAPLLVCEKGAAS